MRRIVLLLGGNKLNRGIIEKFHNKGYLVYVIDWNEHPELTGDRHYQIDVKDAKAIMDRLIEDGVWKYVSFVYSSIDLAVPAVAYINRAIGLHTLSDNALLCSSSKSEMTKKWNQLGLLNRYSIKYEHYSTELYTLTQKMKVIVKPDNSASSRGITILSRGANEKQCINAYKKAKTEATNGLVVVEEFVEGKEFTVEMLGDSYGNVCVYAISKKTHTNNTDANRIAVKLHYNAISDELQQKIAAYGIACYKALGIASSLGHLEIIMKENGELTPVEIGARSSGFIASDLVDIVSGSDYLGDLMNVQNGKRIINGLHSQTKKSSVYFFYDFPENSVMINEHNLMDYMDEPIVSRFHDRTCIKTGHYFSKINNDNARQGFEIIEGPKDILTIEYLGKMEKKMIEETIDFTGNIEHDKSRDIKHYSKCYLSSPFTKENVEYRRKLIIDQIKKYKHNHILEIGCGMYPLFSYLDTEEYNDYTIIEPSDVFVQNALDDIRKRGLDAKVFIKQGYFEEIHIAGNYDFIICSSLLHEVNFPEIILKKIYLTASQETVLHINVPNAYSLHRLIAKEAGLIADVHEFSNRNINLQQNKVYDIDSLEEEVIKAGFSVLEKGSYFIKPFTHKQMADMLENGIIDKNILDGLYEISKYFPEYRSELYINAKKG